MDGEPGSVVSRVCRGKCVGPSPRGVHSLRVEDLDHNWKLDTKKRNVLQLFTQGLQMLHSAKERAFVSMFLCAHLFVSVAPCFFDSHPALSPFAIRRSVIKLYWFYSISCHYQQQYDNWLNLAAGEQWRQQAVVLPPTFSSLLERIKWGLSIRNSETPLPPLVLLDTWCPQTPEHVEPKGSDKK